MGLYIFQTQDSFIGGKFTSYGNVLEKENIKGTVCSYYPGRAKLAASTTNSAGLRVVSRNAKHDLNSVVQSRRRNKFQWVESKQSTY